VNLLLTSVTDAIYYTGISIVNYNSALAERTDPPLTPGVSILSTGRRSTMRPGTSSSSSSMRRSTSGR